MGSLSVPVTPEYVLPVPTHTNSMWFHVVAIGCSTEGQSQYSGGIRPYDNTNSQGKHIEPRPYHTKVVHHLGMIRSRLHTEISPNYDIFLTDN